MRYIFYKVNSSNTDVLKWESSDLSYFTEKNGYFKNYQKAYYLMLLARLESEENVKRQKKIKCKINFYLEKYPEVIFR